MSHPCEVSILRWPGRPPSFDEEGPAALPAACHLRTEAEKGEAVADVDGLRDRCRAEVSDPRAAFAGDVVLMALSRSTGASRPLCSAPRRA
jgi:putative acetyltransferase